MRRPWGRMMDSNVRAGFLEDCAGNRSSTRLMSFISLFQACCLSLLTIRLQDPGTREAGLLLTFGFLLGGFAPKVLQRFAEEKVGTGKGSPGVGGSRAAGGHG